MWVGVWGVQGSVYRWGWGLGLCLGLGFRLGFGLGLGLGFGGGLGFRRTSRVELGVAGKNKRLGV